MSLQRQFPGKVVTVVLSTICGTVAGAILADSAPAVGQAVSSSPSQSVPATWSHDDAAHLLRRAAFGGTPQQIDALFKLGRENAVEYVLTGKLPEGSQPIFASAELKPFVLTPPSDDEARKMDELREAGQAARRDGANSDAASKFAMLRMAFQNQKIRGEYQDVERLRVWWIDRMIRTDRPLEEKMSLFWHNLFTSGVREVRSAKLLADQNGLFHDQALGNYRKLTGSIVHDGAMLRYLNNDQNVKGKPNENLARELMELFTMGEGNGYTEQDIKEVARALTGLAPGGQRRSIAAYYDGGPVVMRSFLHDSGDKTIFGKTGNYGPDEVVDLIFQKPETARYLAKRLWVAFVFADPTNSDLAPVVKAIEESQFEVMPALRVIFNSPSFYGEKAHFALIKSPVELCVETMRLLGRTEPAPLQTTFVERQIAAMDQELMQPPNVRGWVGGDNWITAATLFTRYNAGATMVNGGGAPQRFRGRGAGNAGGGQFPTMDQLQLMLNRRAAAGGPLPSVEEMQSLLSRRASAGAQVPSTEQLQAMLTKAKMGADAPNNSPANALATQPAVAGDTGAAMRPAEAPVRRPDLTMQGGGMRRGFQSLKPVDPATLLANLEPSPTAEKVVDAAIARFLQRPLNSDKRQALIDVLGDEPIKLGTAESDTRVREVIALVLSTPEYQVE